MESMAETDALNPSFALAQEGAPEIDERSESYCCFLKHVYLYVRVNGLAQTLVFLGNSSAPEAGYCLKKLSAWLKGKLGLVQAGEDFVAQIMQRDSRFLRIATREALLYIESLLGKVG